MDATTITTRQVATASADRKPVRAGTYTVSRVLVAAVAARHSSRVVTAETAKAEMAELF